MAAAMAGSVDATADDGVRSTAADADAATVGTGAIAADAATAATGG